MTQHAHYGLLACLCICSASLGAASQPASRPVPPSPDFKVWVDYRGWVLENLCPRADGTAWALYRPILEDESAFEDSVNLFDTQEQHGLAPWAPAEHPDWEASYQASRRVVAQFRKAARDPRPLCYQLDGVVHMDTRETLTGSMVPWTGHYRMLHKTLFAEAWRIQGRAPSPQAMRDALQTSLCSARQLRQDPTLLHQLIASVTRQLAMYNARWALHHQVFKTQKEIQDTLDTLRAAAPSEEALNVAAEHAATLEMIQMLFPLDSEGRLRLDPKSLAFLREILGEVLPGVEKASETEVRSAIKTINTYFAELEPVLVLGMPQIKVADLTRLADKHLKSNVLCSLVVARFDKTYLILSRSEAERRATLLAYELALHKVKAGSYPATLAELTAAKGDDARVDPFTGKFFGYRLEKGQPLVYSWSENGKDDGGKHSPKWGDDAKGGPDDYVFWPPQPGHK